MTPALQAELCCVCGGGLVPPQRRQRRVETPWCHFITWNCSFWNDCAGWVSVNMEDVSSSSLTLHPERLFRGFELRWETDWSRWTGETCQKNCVWTFCWVYLSYIKKQQEAEDRTYKLCFGPHHQKIWNLLVFPRWRLRLLRVQLLVFIETFKIWWILNRVWWICYSSSSCGSGSRGSWVMSIVQCDAIVVSFCSTEWMTTCGCRGRCCSYKVM